MHNKHWHLIIIDDFQFVVWHAIAASFGETVLVQIYSDQAEENHLAYTKHNHGDQQFGDTYFGGQPYLGLDVQNPKDCNTASPYNCTTYE